MRRLRQLEMGGGGGRALGRRKLYREKGPQRTVGRTPRVPDQEMAEHAQRQTAQGLHGDIRCQSVLGARTVQGSFRVPSTCKVYFIMV